MSIMPPDLSLSPPQSSGETGGVEARRGFAFQDFAVILYLLGRLNSYPDLRVLLETDEDATFIYPHAGEGGGTITELIQCKKREYPSYSGMVPDDSWRRGEMHAGHLRAWLDRPPPARHILDRLAADPSLYFTALVCGSLTNSLDNYQPPLLQRVELGSDLRVYRAFPPDLAHERAINDRRDASPEWPESRRRVRLISCPAPHKARESIETVLRTAYGVSSLKAPGVIDRLWALIAETCQVRDVRLRELQISEVRKILSLAQVTQGKWLAGRTFLDRVEASAPTELPQLTRADFDEQRVGQADRFEEVWKQLRNTRFALVYGEPGTGKTTLCKYVLHRYIAQHPQAATYYLRVQPGDELNVEAELFASTLNKPSLFIIDDEHLSQDAVNVLIQPFVDVLTGSAQNSAHLLITSNLIYTPRRAHSRDVRGSAIKQARAKISLSSDPTSCGRLLRELAAKGVFGNSPQLSRLLSKIANVSEGNPALAIIIASLAARSEHEPDLWWLLDGRRLTDGFRNWLLAILGTGRDAAYFEAHIKPILILASCELNIDRSFSPEVDDLMRAGLMTPVTDGEDDSPGQFVSWRILPLARTLTRREPPEKRLAALESYVRFDPRSLGTVIRHLRRRERKLAEDLIYRLRGNVLEEVLLPNSELRLGEVATLLEATRLLNADLARMLFRLMATRDDRELPRFLDDHLSRRRYTGVRELGRYLQVLFDIDRRRLQAIFRRFLRSSRLEELPLYRTCLELIEQPTCPIDEAAFLLRVLHRCSYAFGEALYYDYVEAPEFEHNCAMVERSPVSLVIWMRFCATIKPLNRELCSSLMDEHLVVAEVARSLRRSDSELSLSTVIRGLREIDPRRAFDILDEIWRSYPDALEIALRRERDLNSIANGIYSISQVNRYIAIQTVHQLRDHIEYHLQECIAVRVVASAAYTLQRGVGRTLASTLLHSVRPDQLAESLRREQNLRHIGKTLVNLSEVDARLANELQREVDYAFLLVGGTEFDAVGAGYLIRGLSAASSVDKRARLFAHLDENVDLHHRYGVALGLRGKDGLTPRERSRLSLRDVINLLRLLRDAALDGKAILRITDCQDVEGLKTVLAQRLEVEPNPGRTADALLEMGFIDLPASEQLLEEYIERLEARLSKKASVQGRPSAAADIFGTNDTTLVHFARLLSVASAINLRLARQLARMYRDDLVNLLVDYAKYESNLGTLALFISHLAWVSRRLAGEVVREQRHPELWERQFRSTEDIENIVHYAGSLMRVSRSVGEQYVRHAVSTKAWYDQIYATLESEANLRSVVAWLRVLPGQARELPAEFLDKLFRLTGQVAEIDVRLHHLLEAVEATAEAGEIDLAESIAHRALAQAQQIGSIRHAELLLQVFRRASRVNRRFAGFAETLLGAVDDEKLDQLLLMERNILLSCFGYWLMGCKAAALPNHLQGWHRRRGDQIRQLVARERSSVRRIAAMGLIGTPAEEFAQAFQQTQWHHGWEPGLALLLFRAGGGVEAPAGVWVEGWNALLEDQLDEASNLELALIVMNLCQMEEFSAEAEGLQRLAKARAEDEALRTIQWLLKAAPEADGILDRPDHVWSYLADTLLRTTYLGFTDDPTKGEFEHAGSLAMVDDTA